MRQPIKCAIAFLSLPLLAGCVIITLPPGGFCTAQFVYGLTVRVTDADTGESIIDATITLTNGGYTEIMESFGPGEYVGAGERAGTYSMTIEADGYGVLAVEDIVIESDVCHVIPQSRDETLSLAS